MKIGGTWRHSDVTHGWPVTTWDLILFTQGVELLPGVVWQVSKRNSQYFRSYLRKTTGGALWAPPSGARVNPRPAGGGGGKGPPLWFFENRPWNTGNFALKFAVPPPATILHMLTKNHLWGDFESVVNDVIRRFGPTIRVYRKRHQGRSFKHEQLSYMRWRRIVGLQNCYCGFFSFWKKKNIHFFEHFSPKK